MHRIEPFTLERYFARYEFSARYLLSASDCEPLKMAELLAMADTETRHLWQELKLGYTESPGHPLLREAIAEIYQDFSAEEILVMAPEEAIFLFMQAHLQPEDHVICTFPAYQSLHEVARAMGCSVSYWKPEESNGWYFDPDQLADLFRTNTRLVVVNFPHNPTGALLSRTTYETVIDMVRQHNAYLLSDEMYRFLEHPPHTTLPAGCELYPNAVSLSGLSKSYGLPGLRTGWIATHNRALLKRVAVLKDYTTICNSAPGEILALMALRNRSEIIAGHQRRLQQNLAVLSNFISDYADCFRWQPPAGGSICLSQMTAIADTNLFCEELVTQTGIMLVPSRLFGYGDQHVRIGFGREDMPEVIAVLAAYLDRRLRG